MGSPVDDPRLTLFVLRETCLAAALLATGGAWTGGGIAFIEPAGGGDASRPTKARVAPLPRWLR
jgi:hypothetical protein